MSEQFLKQDTICPWSECMQIYTICISTISFIGKSLVSWVKNGIHESLCDQQNVSQPKIYSFLLTRLLPNKLIVEIEIVYICTHSDQGQMVFCFKNCSDILWEKIVVVIEKIYLNSEKKNFSNLLLEFSTSI